MPKYTVIAHVFSQNMAPKSPQNFITFYDIMSLSYVESLS
uniref:Uncharacterized protein n=1 Tax=Amphimedon queenslandica TaxID=400682 RepID=A0A1X7UHA2_AMPQE